MSPFLVLASCACLVGTPPPSAPVAPTAPPTTTPASATAAPSWRVGAAAATTGALAVATSVVGVVNVALAVDLAEDSRQSVEGTALRGADVVQAESALVATGVAFYAGLLLTALAAAGTAALVLFDAELEGDEGAAFSDPDAGVDAAAGAASTGP
jgi:hypothetical protein